MSKTVVFRAHLLMGDAIYASAVIGRYVREHPEDKIVIECLDDYPKEIYQWIPNPYQNLSMTFATDTPCDVLYEFDMTEAMVWAAQKDIGIWHGLAAVSRVTWDGEETPAPLAADNVPILNIPSMEIPELWKGAYVICPYSRSCSSHSGQPANKTFSTRSWTPLLRYLRRHGKVLFVGGNNDRMRDFAFDESECVAGYPLSVAASVFRAAKCVIAVDNGLARVSTLVGANTVTLMPDFLPLNVFAPAQWANRTSRVVQIDVRMDGPSLAASMKYLLRMHAKVL